MIYEILLGIIAIIATSFLFFKFAPFSFAPSTQQYSVGTVCFGKNCFNVEIAKTVAQREAGLMNRAKLDKDKGMLFVFNKEGIHPFWMKNTLISLDIIWIGSNSKVVFIIQNVQPCTTLICPSVVPNLKAKYVIELNSGTCQEIGLKVGDLVQIPPGL